MDKTQRSEYERGDVERFFNNLTSMMNQISEDPLNEELNAPQSVRFPFFPLMLDLNQFYFIIKELYKSKLLDNAGYIITNRDYSKINEVFCVNVTKSDDEEIGTNQLRYQSDIISLDEIKYIDVYKKLNEFTSKFDVKVFKYFHNFLQTEFNFDMGNLVILPEHIAHVGILDDTDYVNSDIIRYFKDFVRRMRKGLGKELKLMPVIEYTSKKNRDNPLVNLFIKLGSVWSNIDIDKYIDFFLSMFNGFSMNIILYNEMKKPVSISRLLIEDKIVHLNPVPITFLKKYIISDQEECYVEEFTKALYSHTKIATVSIGINQMVDFLKKTIIDDYPMAETFIDMVQFSNNKNVFPESIIATLISNLGIEYNKNIPYLKEFIKKIVGYYERILLGILVIKPEGRILDSILSIFINEKGFIDIEVIPNDNFKNYFKEDKTTDVINKFEEAVSLKTGEKYPLVMIFKAKEFIDMFSYQNLKSIIEMTRFIQSLPGLERISSLMKNISTNGELISPTEEKEKSKESGQSRKIGKNLVFLEEIPQLNHFLSKGITVKIAKGKELLLIKDPNHLETGHLGLNIKIIKEIIKKQYPNLLKK
ncbi:MAG: hypothetical protein GY870_21080 [archaeon]|nr:hypothetical protein [archaeon]